MHPCSVRFITTGQQSFFIRFSSRIALTGFFRFASSITNADAYIFKINRSSGGYSIPSDPNVFNKTANVSFYFSDFMIVSRNTNGNSNLPKPLRMRNIFEPYRNIDTLGVGVTLGATYEIGFTYVLEN